MVFELQRDSVRGQFSKTPSGRREWARLRLERQRGGLHCADGVGDSREEKEKWEDFRAQRRTGLGLLP